MKKLIALHALFGAVTLGAPGIALAQDKGAPAATTTTTVTDTVKVEEKKEEAKPAGPTPNKGDVAWMLMSTALVIMMSIPALALFYGGMVRAKNMLSVLMQVFVTFALVTVLWCIYGYSLAFTEGNSFIGGFDRLFLRGDSGGFEDFRRRRRRLCRFARGDAGATPSALRRGIGEG